MTRNQSDVDTLDKVFEEGTDGRDYTIETEHGTIEYELHRVSRARRQEFLNSLPDELIEFMEKQEREKKSEFDVDELSELEDIDQAKPDESPPMNSLGRRHIEEFEDLIIDALDHPQITDRETRDFFDYWSDKMFYTTAFLIIGISADDDGVDGFRTE